jgi:hypothetical protein
MLLVCEVVEEMLMTLTAKGVAGRLFLWQCLVRPRPLEKGALLLLLLLLLRSCLAGEQRRVT